MIYLISDLHLDHKNIIRYCNRPFNSLEEMNNTIVNNWNKTVTENDTIFLIGDLAFGRNREYWLKQLKGNIILIRGNHDRGLKTKPFIILVYRKKRFLLIHNSYYANDWNGWIIHGHSHNNTPLIDRDNKRINVSCELLNYKPIPVNDLLKVL